MVSRIQPIPIRLNRVTQAVADAFRARRPQMPQPPFPYSQREISFTNPVDNVTIAGTLTIPGGAGPFACVALLSDTGVHTRDHEEGTHKPYLVLADLLARRGYAVLRTDDRGMGRSEGAHDASTLDDATRDIGAAIAFLKSQHEIDPGRIGLLGRGEGAVVAAKAAVSTDVGFIILLGPAGFPGAKVLEQRETAILTAQGDRPDYIKARAEHLARTLNLAASNAPNEQIRAAIADDLKSRVAAQHDWGGLTDAQLSEGIDAQFNIYTTPRSRSWLAEDPAASLSALKCPVLAVFAERDMFILTPHNQPKVESLLQSGVSSEHSVVVIPAANHYFQHANTGFDEEHDRLDETVAPDVVELIAAFLSRRSGTSRP
jgi:pimeloyl-ACP methyl ester carboxylesterase